VFKRILDLGCGNAPYYPLILPPTLHYVGVDITRPSLEHLKQHPEIEFRQGSALEQLDLLKPGKGDLVISIFSAHHIGLSALLDALARARAQDADVMVIDSLRMSDNWFAAHYLLSLFGSSAALATSTASLKARTPNRYFLSDHVQFLLSRYGIAHAAEDFEMIEPASFAELAALARGVSSNSSVMSVRRSGALGVASMGSSMMSWFFGDNTARS